MQALLPFCGGKVSIFRKLKKVSTQFKQNTVERKLTVLLVRNRSFCGVGYIRSCKAIKMSKVKLIVQLKV